MRVEEWSAGERREKNEGRKETPETNDGTQNKVIISVRKEEQSKVVYCCCFRVRVAVFLFEFLASLVLEGDCARCTPPCSSSQSLLETVISVAGLVANNLDCSSE